MEYTIKLNGREYPARFTVRTAIRAAERGGGSLSKLLQRENQGELLENLLWLAIELIKAGAGIREREDGIVTKDIPSLDELMDSVDFADVPELQAQILTVMNKDEPTVRAEGDRKNAGAAPAN